ncbi:YcaO-like family protein [Streptomyces pseudovenezuelae]|uniref:YcaO-like family protein n=1 Tax=Streptomyces pseudovenezuelae TaxID=67350 RepID=UPI002E7FE8FB|nr:YcaO-like family protein [Streptomyces pseudovenezuelae]WUA85909.1 YcaO-like family protein [Streptomyces pseudovenezuelae]
MDGFSAELTAGLRALVSPYGVVSEVLPGTPVPGLDGLFLASAKVNAAPGVARPGEFRGTGRSLAGPGAAELIALAEAAERYAGADFPGTPEVWATPAQLDGAVLDMTALPRCSEREYASGRCPVVPYRPDTPVRWLRGVDMASRESVWVPAVMARHGMRRLAPAERFWNRISTGYAVHSDPAEALLRGLCEVCERDAAALTWLQMLPLPRIEFAPRTPVLGTLLEHGERHFVDTRFYDATTDTGVPTVYCVQIAEHDDACRRSVSCAAGRDLTEAAEKALLEAVPARALFHRADPDTYALVMAGAQFMGRAEQRHAFDFLLGQSPVHRAEDRPGLPRDPVAALARIIGALSERGMQAVAVDRTTRELAAAGLTAVCVVVPALQPLTFHRYGQYRAHPRLYAAPVAMGCPSRPEEELNPWPQPFL